MKKLLLILLCLPMIGFGQQTYVPDDNFEAYLEANGMGNGIPNDDYVNTASINTVTYLGVSALNIFDLTGIEDFTNLTYLDCSGNNLTSLDISQNAIDFLICNNNQLTSINLNTNLLNLSCWENNLTNLNVSSNTNLTYLYCGTNQLTTIDLSQNPYLSSLMADNNALTEIDLSNNPNLTGVRLDNNLLNLLDLSYQDIQYLNCSNNQITDLIIDSDSLNELFCGNNPISFFDATQHINLEMLEIFNTGLFNIDLSQNLYLWFLSIGSNPDLWSLDLSNNYFLEHLDLYSNSLSNLDMRNGNNQNISYFVTWNCWNSPFLDCISVDDSIYSTNNWTSIDSWHYFSNNCNPLAIQEHSSKKELLKIIDLLGRETKGTNQPLFYIYDDGTVEKRIIIE